MEEYKAFFSTGLSVSQKHLLQDHWGIIEEHLEENGLLFAVKFFTAYPQYQQHFKVIKSVPLNSLSNCEDHKNEACSVVEIVGTFITQLNERDAEALIQSLKSTGNAYYYRGMDPQYFMDFGKTFVEFLAETLESHLNDEGKQAWASTLGVMLTIIQQAMEEERRLMATTPNVETEAHQKQADNVPQMQKPVEVSEPLESASPNQDTSPCMSHNEQTAIAITQEDAPMEGLSGVSSKSRQNTDNTMLAGEKSRTEQSEDNQSIDGAPNPPSQQTLVETVEKHVDEETGEETVLNPLSNGGEQEQEQQLGEGRVEQSAPDTLVQILSNQNSQKQLCDSTTGEDDANPSTVKIAEERSVENLKDVGAEETFAKPQEDGVVNNCVQNQLNQDLAETTTTNELKDGIVDDGQSTRPKEIIAADNLLQQEDGIEKDVTTPEWKCVITIDSSQDDDEQKSNVTVFAPEEKATDGQDQDLITFSHHALHENVSGNRVPEHDLGPAENSQILERHSNDDLFHDCLAASEEISTIMKRLSSTIGPQDDVPSDKVQSEDSSNDIQQPVMRSETTQGAVSDKSICIGVTQGSRIFKEGSGSELVADDPRLACLDVSKSAEASIIEDSIGPDEIKGPDIVVDVGSTLDDEFKSPDVVVENDTATNNRNVEVCPEIDTGTVALGSSRNDIENNNKVQCAELVKIEPVTDPGVVDTANGSRQNCVVENSNQVDVTAEEKVQKDKANEDIKTKTGNSLQEAFGNDKILESNGTVNGGRLESTIKVSAVPEDNEEVQNGKESTEASTKRSSMSQILQETRMSSKNASENNIEQTICANATSVEMHETFVSAAIIPQQYDDIADDILNRHDRQAIGVDLKSQTKIEEVNNSKEPDAAKAGDVSSTASESNRLVDTSSQPTHEQSIENTNNGGNQSMRVTELAIQIGSEETTPKCCIGFNNISGSMICEQSRVQQCEGLNQLSNHTIEKNSSEYKCKQVADETSGKKSKQEVPNKNEANNNNTDAPEPNNDNQSPPVIDSGEKDDLGPREKDICPTSAAVASNVEMLIIKLAESSQSSKLLHSTANDATKDKEDVQMDSVEGDRMLCNRKAVEPAVQNQEAMTNANQLPAAVAADMMQTKLCCELENTNGRDDSPEPAKLASSPCLKEQQQIPCPCYDSDMKETNKQCIQKPERSSSVDPDDFVFLPGDVSKSAPVPEEHNKATELETETAILSQQVASPELQTGSVAPTEDLGKNTVFSSNDVSQKDRQQQETVPIEAEAVRDTNNNKISTLSITDVQRQKSTSVTNTPSAAAGILQAMARKESYGTMKVSVPVSHAVRNDSVQDSVLSDDVVTASGGVSTQPENWDTEVPHPHEPATIATELAKTPAPPLGSKGDIVTADTANMKVDEVAQEAVAPPSGDVKEAVPVADGQ